MHLVHVLHSIELGYACLLYFCYILCTFYMYVHVCVVTYVLYTVYIFLLGVHSSCWSNSESWGEGTRPPFSTPGGTWVPQVPQACQGT